MDDRAISFQGTQGVGKNAAQPGVLYVVGTPIGNLSDLSWRAFNILSSCDCIACETPQVTQKLLTLLNIPKKPLFTYRDAGEIQSAQHLLRKLQNQQSVALVSDAGTPSISDPGYRLMKICQEQGVRVVPIPGPNAAIAALSMAGLHTNAFLFLGFLPPKEGKIAKLFQANQAFRGTIVLYESPHRIQKLILTLRKFFDTNTRIAIAHELTKLNESCYYGTLEDLDESTLSLKGEYVVLIEQGD